MDEGFEQIQKQLKHIEKQLDEEGVNHEERLRNIEKKVQTIDSIEEKLDEMRGRLNKHIEDNEDRLRQMENFQSRLEGAKSTFAALAVGISGAVGAMISWFLDKFF